MSRSVTKKKPRVGVAERIAEFRAKRKEVKELDEFVKTIQPSIIALMKEFDPDNHGIIYNPEDQKEGAAYVQQNSGSEVWDNEAIIEFLRNRKSNKMWMACSSRVFDVQKWEAEIANGNVPKKTAKRFLKKNPDPKPFIRFGKITKESVSG